METISYLEAWVIEHPNTKSVLKFVFWVVIILFIISLLRKLLKRNLPDNSIRYKSQKGIEIVGYVLIILLSISYFTGNIKDFTLAIGLLSAGITITLQELILSVAGSF